MLRMNKIWGEVPVGTRSSPGLVAAEEVQVLPSTCSL